MSLPIADIGDAITNALDAYFGGGPIVVQRRYVTQQEPGDIGSLLVTVVPVSDEPVTVTRGSIEHRYTYQIVFQHKMTGGTEESRTEQIDGILETVQDTIDELDWAEMDGAKWVGEVVRENLFERDADRQQNQFTAAFTVAYMKHIARS